MSSSDRAHLHIEDEIKSNNIIINLAIVIHKSWNFCLFSSSSIITSNPICLFVSQN